MSSTTLSTTTLTRSEQGPGTSAPRVRSLLRTDSPKPPRGPRRLRKRVGSRRADPRAIDVYVRSVPMWGRNYR